MKEYIHYGHKEFDKNKFTKVTNDHSWVKPTGGLWASPIDSNRSWKDFCYDNDFRECNEENSFKFTLTEDAKVLHLRSTKDLEGIPEQKDSLKLMSTYCIDFEKLMEMGYDAVELHLSEDCSPGGWMDSLYWKLYGWDCDSIVILNPDIVVPKCA